MLDAWIIKKIKEKEKEVLEDKRPALQLPLYSPIPSQKEGETEEKRGVIIIDISGGE